jgi:hypothetical protein
MQGRTWIKLLQRIPPEQHDTLAITTTTGTEISIQTVFRMEDDLMIIRGRMSGTTDLGRVFFIPYDQINYLTITREVRETEIRALLGDAPKLAPAVQRILDTPSPSQLEIEEAQPAPPPAPVPEAAPTTPVPVKAGANLSIPRRSGLIARLRARTNVAPAAEPPPKP